MFDLIDCLAPWTPTDFRNLEFQEERLDVTRKRPLTAAPVPRFDEEKLDRTPAGPPSARGRRFVIFYHSQPLSLKWLGEEVSPPWMSPHIRADSLNR